MTQQFPDFIDKADVVVILGGESKDRERSKVAIEIDQLVTPVRERDLYHITTGWCSGTIPKDYRPGQKDSHAAQMALYLEANGVSPTRILQERGSLDSIANYVFVRPMLEELGAQNIVIISDKLEQPRATRTSRWVWGDNYTINVIPVATPKGLFQRFVEFTVNNFTRIDHTLFGGLQNGDKEAWDRYMQTVHPFHAEDPKFSLYGFGVKLMGQNIPDEYKETY